MISRLHTISTTMGPRLHPGRALVLLGLLASTTPALAQHTTSPSTGSAAAATSPRIPLDTAVRMGVLPNGLRYYIRHNARPAGRGYFALFVDAGSLVEDDDQRGLAHFVEHSAFDGSTHFPQHRLWDLLPLLGLQIGVDANAGTNFDETLYHFETPADPGIVDSVLLILDDFAHGVIFTPDAVTHERGAVFEERRLNQGPPGQSDDPHLVMLRGARYARRIPIGTGETILHAPVSAIERFYRDWYRPDLETVIAIGDFDPRAMEAKITATFGRIPMPASPRAHPTFPPPVYDTAVVSVGNGGSDKGAETEIVFRNPQPDTAQTEAAVRARTAEELCHRIVNRRLAAFAKTPGAPFQEAGLGYKAVGRYDHRTVLIVRTKESITLEAGIMRATAEVARFAREGPTPAELALAQQQLVLRTAKDSLADQNPTNFDLFNSITDDARRHLPVVDQLAEERTTIRLAPTVTAAEVQAVAARTLATRGPILLVDVSGKDDYGLPAGDQILAAFKEGTTRTFPSIVVPQDTTPTLLTTRPTPGRIVQERVLPGMGVTAWTLSNGARVLLKPLHLQRGSLFLGARSLGGVSIASDRDYPSAVVTSDLIKQSGLGPYDARALDRALVNQVNSWNVGIGQDVVTADVVGSMQHPEIMFQLLHLAFTAPRLDTAKLSKWRFDARREKFTGRDIETLRATTQHNPRVRPVIGATADSVDPETILRFYRESFADAGRFTFVIVGDFTADQLRPLVEEYIGGLPGRPSATPYRGKDLGIRPPTGIVQQTIADDDSTSTTSITFSAATPVTPHTGIVAAALSSIFEARVLTRVRWQLGGSYSPSGSCGLQVLPYPHGTCSVDFTSSPDRAVELQRAVMQLVDSLTTYGVTQTELEAARTVLLRHHAVDVQQGGFWDKFLTSTVTDGTTLDDLAGWEQQVKTMTTDQITQMARVLLSTKRYVQVTSLPLRLLPSRPDEMRSALQW